MGSSLSDALKIATPCDRDVAAMEDAASGRAKYCAFCEREVHTIAEMTRAEVVALLAANEGQPLCLSLLVRRTDRAVRIADGHVHPTRIGRSPSARLPLLAAAASMTFAACAPPGPATPTPELVPVERGPVVPSEPAPVAIVPEPPRPEPPAPPAEPTPLVTAEPTPTPLEPTRTKDGKPAPVSKTTKLAGPKKVGKPVPQQEEYEVLAGARSGDGL